MEFQGLCPSDVHPFHCHHSPCFQPQWLQYFRRTESKQRVNKDGNIGGPWVLLHQIYSYTWINSLWKRPRNQLSYSYILCKWENRLEWVGKAEAHVCHKTLAWYSAYNQNGTPNCQMLPEEQRDPAPNTLTFKTSTFDTGSQTPSLKASGVFIHETHKIISNRKAVLNWLSQPRHSIDGTDKIYPPTFFFPVRALSAHFKSCCLKVRPMI